MKYFVSVLCLFTLLFASCKVDIGTEKPSEPTENVDTKPNDETPLPVSYTVTYIAKRGTAPQPITVNPNTVLSANQLPAVSNDKYNFSGWYDGNKRVEAGKYIVTKDVTLVARWDFDEPLTFEVIYAGDIVIKNPWSTLKYSKNGGDLIAVAGNITLNVELGDIICLYSEGSENTTQSSGMSISGLAVSYIYGNIMSLVSFDRNTGKWNPDATSVTDYAFAGLFNCHGGITSHDSKDLYLPATTLGKSCYAAMFSCCNDLYRAPALPAVTLAEYCYSGMFAGSAVRQGPDLLANTLVKGCYEYMFMSCGLNYIKCLATDFPEGSSATEGWLIGASQSGTFIKAKGIEAWSRDENGIPANWTVQEED